MHYSRAVPSVQNDPQLTQLLESACREAWGNERVQIINEPSLGAEDFSVYLEQVPGCMFRLGVGIPEQKNHPLHHPQFDIDEAAIVTGVVALAYTAYQYYQSI